MLYAFRALTNECALCYCCKPVSSLSSVAFESQLVRNAFTICHSTDTRMEFPEKNRNRIDIEFFVKNLIEIESRGKNQNRHITRNSNELSTK